MALNHVVYKKILIIKYFPFQSILLVNFVSGTDKSYPEFSQEKVVLIDLTKFSQEHICSRVQLL